jgi:hypothetical protein
MISFATAGILSVLTVATLLACYWAFLNYRKYQLNIAISDELNKIIENTAETIKKGKESLRAERERLESEPMSLDSPELFDQPELMATIITVLVHKYGNVRLSMHDFMIPDSEYVSVYVDTATQEIILSLDRNLDPATDLINFTKTDDTTFH